MAKTQRYKLVLLLDDNPMDNFVNQKILEVSNFAENIIVFQSGQDTLNHLKSVKSPDIPDIIFLDIMMPVMDGFAFLEAFENLPDFVKNKCRVIMLSTSDSFKDLNRANKCRFVFKFLNKPLTSSVLDAINI
jgi:CheY-like chemotaxis protein